MKVHRSIVLIGMAGAGKSTVGQALAARLAMPFIDTDTWLSEREERSLQELLTQEGVAGFKAAEERAIVTLPAAPKAVIATGGSVIYSALAVTSLRALGDIIYLRASYEVVTQRVSNWQTRGFVGGEGKTLLEIFNEREPLYQAAADSIIDVDSRSVENIVNDIIQQASRA